MNNIINWIATNNTLMIRVGFTAILILLAIYVFRFFFVPKVNVVAEAAAKKQKADEIEKTTEYEKAESVQSVESNEAVGISEEELGQKNLEIQRLKEENSILTRQVEETKNTIADLEMKLSEAVSINEVKASETLKATDSISSEIDTDLVSSLNQKIEQLESRLAEYEIIAEEISEISDLRKENAELKKKISAAGVDAESEIAAKADIEIEEEPLEETLQETLEETQPKPEGEKIEDAIGSALDDFFSMQEQEQKQAQAQAQEPTPLSEPELEPEPTPEPQAESSESPEPSVEDLQSELAELAEAMKAAEDEVKKDENISTSEKDLLAEFEEIANKKGS